jgi:hypothetical protein
MDKGPWRPLRGLIGAGPGAHVLPLSFDKPFARGG